MEFLKKVLLVVFVGVFSVIYSQDKTIEYKDYKLSEEVVRDDSVMVEKGESEITLISKDVIEYVFIGAGLAEYNLVHRRVRLLTDKSIERNNKVYIPLGANSELDKYQARVILPNGTIKELGDKAIQEGVDEESGYRYKYFAFEGIEIGSEIEYFYLKKGGANYNGRRQSIQGMERKFNVSFELICPSHLVFAFKTYNGLPTELVKDTTLKSKNKWFLKLDEVEEYKSQESSFTLSNLKYLIYKLDKNKLTGTNAVVNYDKVSGSLYSRVFIQKDKTEKKIIDKIVKQIGVKSTTEEGKVREIENFLKANYSFIKVEREEFSNLEFIFEKKAYNEIGGIHLMSLILKRFDISHQFVITCNRTSTPFDEKFESYNFLIKPFLYFSSLDLYLDITTPMLRLGYVDSDYMNTYGLFIKPVEVSGHTLGMGEVKWIKPLGKETTTSNIYVDVEMDDLFEPTYKINHNATGFYASSVQCIYDLIKDEADKDKVAKSFIEYIDEEGEIENVKVENAGGAFFGQKPYKVSANLITDKFIENAGDKRLFKLGDLIGPQMELYQEEGRIHPIQSDYNRSYHRELAFNIPEGYKVVNLKDAEINETYKIKDVTTMAFISKLKIEGSKVKVVIDEYYDVLDLPKEEFSAYQRVINAAANFNKVVLIFEKN